MEKNVIIIEPQLGQVIAAGIPTDKGKTGYEGVRNEFLKGNCTVFTLPSGDRIIAGPRGFGKLDTKGEEFKALSQRQGAFAVLAEAIDPTSPDAKNGIAQADGAFLAEVLGPAVLVGPKPAEGPDDLTPTTLPLEEMRKRIAFNRQGMLGNGLGDLLAALLSRAPADKAEGEEGEERPWSDSVNDPELVEFRKTLTDEELAECPCPGCQEEQARRVQAAGGSTAKN